LDQAVAEHRKAIELDPKYALAHSSLGVALLEQGKLGEAIACLKEAIDLDPKFAEPHYYLGNTLLKQGKLDEAIAEYRQAIRLNPDDAGAHNNLGVALLEQGKHKEAEAAYRHALDLFKNLVSAHPGVPRYRLRLAGTQVNFGNLLQDRKHLDEEAVLWYDRALALLEPLHKQAPDDARTRSFLRNAHWGRARAQWGRPAEALPHWDRAVDLSPPADPDRPRMLRDRAGTQVNLGHELRAKNRPDEALGWYDRALALLEPLHKQAPDDVETRRFLRNAHSGRARALWDLQRNAEALPHWDRAIELSPPADRPSMQRDRAGTQVNYGNELCAKHRPDEALPWYERALALLESLHKQAPDDATTRRFLRNAHWGRAAAFHDLKRYADAMSHWDRAVELSPANARPLLQMKRAASRARSGKIAEAVVEAEALTKDAAAPGGLLYDAACVYALASAAVKDDARQQEAYAGQAVALLRRAQTAEFFKDRAKVEHLKKDPDLDVLRSREDFKKFVAELEAAAKP
jgi:tetratricopeptide (TPR) repeat protein